MRRTYARPPTPVRPRDSVSCFVQVNIHPPFWEGGAGGRGAPDQAADAYEVNAARSISSVSAVVPAWTLMRTFVARTEAETP